MIRAAIFDLDGTVADNMPWHARAWLQLAREIGGVAIDEQWVYARAGMKNEDLIPELAGRPVDVQRLSERKEELYRSLYTPAPLAGLLELLDALQARGVRLAVASAAPLKNRDFLLDGLRIRARFAAEIGAEHVKRGKPAPDMFLAAAAALGAKPEDALVVEDAVNGVRAAKAAGCPCLAVTTTARAEDLTAAGAQLVVRDFKGVDVAALLQLRAP